MTVSPSAQSDSLSPPGALLAEYRGVKGYWDEAVAADGKVRPYWQKLLDEQASLTPHEARSREDLCRRLLKEYGVTYNSPIAGEQGERAWQLDSWPLLISPTEWRSLSQAVSQRARLLNEILKDIYGPRKLLHSGDLPPQVVLANPAFVRAASGLASSQGDPLTLYAVDLARSPDGQWWVVSDRTDTPAGAGYTLENRIVLNRVYPDLIRECMVERLAKFFSQIRDSLLARAKPRDSEPRVVILTPGPYHATYFEQVYLARYLGFNLVEGEDLTVRDQGVFLKTLNGLVAVDVILRRVGSDFCDPLELREDSLLGVPGLLQAARAGKVLLANSIGVGVVETPALLPFLPSLCQRLLGEKLLLPPVATWWCGQETALKTVLGKLNQIVVKHAFPSRDVNAFLPGKSSTSELRALLLSNPHLFVGQEYVALSTAPTWQDDKVIPRHLMLRLFAVATGDGNYAVMPGGLTRCGNSPDSMIMSAQSVGGSKDTWILSDAPPDPTTLLPSGTRSSALSRAGFILSSRLADNLFWLGRYMERIEFGCRMARSLLQRLTDEAEQDRLGAYSFILRAFAAHGRLPSECRPVIKHGTAEQYEELLGIAVFDTENTASIAADIGRVYRISSVVRDRLSTDAWKILRSMHEGLSEELGDEDASREDRMDAIEGVLSKVLTFSGQSMDGMTRDKGWRFLDLGRRLERAANLCDLICHALVRPSTHEDARLQAVLEIANSAMTYRSRYVFGPDPAPVLDLLLADESNPRSVAFQISALYQHVKGLKAKHEGSGRVKEQRIVYSVFSEMRLIDVDGLAVLVEHGKRSRMAVVLKRITRAMEDLSRTLTRSYLTHVQTARPLGGSGE